MQKEREMETWKERMQREQENTGKNTRDNENREETKQFHLTNIS